MYDVRGDILGSPKSKQDLIVVLITCKNEEDLFKNKVNSVQNRHRNTLNKKFKKSKEFLD